MAVSGGGSVGSERRPISDKTFDSETLTLRSSFTETRDRSYLVSHSPTATLSSTPSQNALSTTNPRKGKTLIDAVEGFVVSLLHLARGQSIRILIPCIVVRNVYLHNLKTSPWPTCCLQAVRKFSRWTRDQPDVLSRAVVIKVASQSLLWGLLYITKQISTYGGELNNTRSVINVSTEHQ